MPVMPITIIPINITSPLRNFPASRTIHPIPEVAATISEETSVVYVNPILTLIPVKIPGRHEGKTTWLKSLNLPAPSD